MNSYDETDKWTWNYKGLTEVPGHWRGWYEYYYDTVRSIHPWEMLGFYDKPVGGIHNTEQLMDCPILLCGVI